MTKRRKILSRIALGLAVLLTLVAVATVAIVRTDWFREYVRGKIIASTEEATGGKVEVGSFSFEVSGMRAAITNFVIHGREPAGAAPFLSAALVELDFRLFTSIKHILDITYLGIEKPQVNVMVFPDGTTNIPSPKGPKAASDTTVLETVVNLAVGRFNLSNGLIVANARKQEFDLRGNNLQAELRFNPLTQSYSGRLGMEPLYVVAGKNTPVNFRIVLPISLEKDRLDLRGATITTPTSTLAINGKLENLRKPRISGHVNGHISLADARSLGNLSLVLDTRNAPDRIDIDANATVSDETIEVSAARIGLGQSTIQATGRLKDPQGKGSLQFKARVAVGEVGRLARVAVRPEGVVELNGVVMLDAANNYDVNGNLLAKDLSFIQGAQRISNVELQSGVHLDPHRLELQALRLRALGGEVVGTASMQDFRLYQLDGNLRAMDIQTVVHALGAKPLPYSGVVSGALHVGGDLQAAGTKSLVAQTKLSISPGRRGIPVTGKLNASYSGADDSVAVQNSYVSLPHTRLTLDGALNRKINVVLNTSNLNDLLAAVPASSMPRIELNGGQAKFNGTIAGALTNPVIAGRLEADRFSIEGRAFQLLAADVSAAGTGAAIRNGSLIRGPMNAQFSATAGLARWSPLPREPLTADISLQGGDVADAMVLAGQAPAGYSGALTAKAHVQGTIGNPLGNADIQASTGSLDGEPFDRAEIHVTMADRLITVPAAYITAGMQRLDLSGEFQHAPDSLSTGHLHAHIKSNQLDLARVQLLQRQRPNTGGTLQMDVEIAGDLSQAKDGSQFLVTQVTANGSAKNLMADGQNYGDATISANTMGQTVNYNLTSNFAGSSLQVNGKTQLIADYPATADATIGHLPIQRVLVLAKQADIPARGDLSGTVHFSGTVAMPEGSGDLELTNAVLYDEPLDHVRARMTYRSGAVEVQELQLARGTARIDVAGRFDHPANNWNSGNVEFKIDSSRIDLATVRNARRLRQGLGGVLSIHASGAGTLRAAEPRMLLSRLDADVAATDVTVQKSALGNLTLKADTVTGNQVAFVLESNLAGATIHGDGHAQLTADYPVDARVTFSNVLYSRINSALGTGGGATPSFEAGTDGVLTLSGPVMKTEQLRGALQLTKVNVDTVARPGTSATVSIRNEGPVRLVMDNGTVRVENAHLTGPQTDIQVTGTASVPQQTLNLNLNATANLALLQSMSRDIVSSGAIAAAGTVRGTFSKPQINGQLELKNASLNYTTVPNGISNANGVIVFNGTNATIRSLTAETGGGRLTASGFVGYADQARFGLRLQATSVRWRVQQGVSAVGSAEIRLTGGIASSVVAGDVTIEQLTYAPQSDIGSMLSRSAEPVQSESAPSPVLDNMKLDIRVRTSPSLGVQASLAQNLQAVADLRLRGTAAQPGALGRITISKGQLVFFGSTYTVNTGTIGFFDPLRITPVLNMSLETQAKGVQVVLMVTGPVDNMKLSYSSDPPLQFQEIIALLASGKTPTSDPTLLANEPSQPSQSFEQMGESAIVSKALADPVASRLQRVFGVTQLKIDPAFTSGSQLPTARLTFQQQITSNVTFTYTSALDDPNSSIVRVEWSFNPQYSAVATRDQNGLVSVLLYYKKQFR